MEKRKFTKCECCLYYGKNYETKKWKCSLRDCIFNSKTGDYFEIREAVINNWLNANNGIEAKDKSE